MAGGLLQIASYGIHDIYLIGNPQITFFKTVYRQHTNFSMEYFEEVLDGIHNFGGNLSCTISKTSDLLHKIYLKINLPSVLINKNNINNSYNLYDDIYKKNIIINDYINIINYNLVQKLYNILSLENISYTIINSKYLLYKKQINYLNILEKIKTLYIKFNNKFYIPLNPITYNGMVINIDTDINIIYYLELDQYYNYYINTSYLESDLKNQLQKLLDKYSYLLKVFKEQTYKLLLFHDNIKKKYTRNNINFSWVEKIGYQIIKKLNIEIGGKQIDFTDSIIMDIYRQLTNKISHSITLDNLIGNIPELTTFDNLIKPSYTLIIPIDFWFTKFPGLALPLIHLRYHDVKINIELNDLINCCYFEKTDDLIIENEISLTGNVSLIANYIFLDTLERNKFGQSEHEYLIDQIQKIDINSSLNIINTQLNFFNPIKQIFWIIRNVDNINRGLYFDYSCNIYIDIYDIIKYDSNNILINTPEINISKYISIGDNIKIINSIYYSGDYIVNNIINDNSILISFPVYIKEDYKFNYDYLNNKIIKSNNYIAANQAFIKKINNINPIKFNTIEFNGLKLLNKTDDIYHNFVQPYKYNTKTPNYGINTYSFALYPELYQPSGFCNFNRIDHITAILELNNNYNYNNSILSIYALGYNILKFSNGKGAIILNI